MFNPYQNNPSGPLALKCMGQSLSTNRGMSGSFKFCLTVFSGNSRILHETNEVNKLNLTTEYLSNDLP